MNVEVLLSTMNQCDKSILDKMNIQSDIIIINQCDKYDYNDYLYNGNKAIFYSFNEKGIGLSRNTALMRSKGDICLMADDDLIYQDNYEENIVKAFEENDTADVIIFEVDIHEKEGTKSKKLKKKKVGYGNYMQFGAVRIAFKREIIQKKGIYFSLLFGGGAKYGSGEDTLFLEACLRNRLKIMSYPLKIADVYNYNSSWFNGYNKNFFRDKGALFAALSNNFYLLLILQFAIRKRNLFKNHMSFKNTIFQMLYGAREYKNN